MVIRMRVRRKSDTLELRGARRILCAHDSVGHLLVHLGFPVFSFPDFEMFDLWTSNLKQSDLEISRKMIKVFWGDPGQNGGF